MRYCWLLVGVSSQLVRVEAWSTRTHNDIGLRNASARTASGSSALQANEMERNLVVNLAPGDLPKKGSAFDLAIACPRRNHELRLSECDAMLLEARYPASFIVGWSTHLVARGAGLKAPSCRRNGAAARPARTEVRVADHLHDVLLAPTTRPSSTSPRRTRTPCGAMSGAGTDDRDVRGQDVASRA